MSVVVKTYEAPPVDKREVLRYARCAEPTAEVEKLLDECLKEAGQCLSYKVCYRELSVSVSGEVCNFDMFSLTSKSLAKCLCESKRAIVFAATVGVALDRLIAKYNKIAPSKALMLQAIGAERVEALCDVFCKEMNCKKCGKTCARFSPGYGDLSLEVQKDVFLALDCAKNIGIFLNDSLLMSPSKSVTAFFGISEV